ncbi:MAG: hypothetical protein Q9216_005983 [Gyalolechia sp. 2 TL-2023]
MINPQASIEHYLHAHSRAITDINFSAHHPDILATCAVDSYVHCWDLRHPSRAAMTFCDWFAGSTQVKWNRQDSHILASSHNKFLRIWDDRKGAYPLRSIEAHATKIYGVDWNRTETHMVATCSLDKTIKFWDYSNESDNPVATISASFPVWRARHTPFGVGLLAMPQRGDHDLHLFDRREHDQSEEFDPMPMVHRFDGHEGQVKEFLWRARGSVQDSRDSRDFQLISWGTDRMLRLHRVDEELLAKVGHVRGQQVERAIPFTRKNAEYRSFRGKPATTTNNVGDLKGERRFTLDLQGEIGMSGAGMRRQSLGLGGVWATGENPLSSMIGKKTRSSIDVDAISWMKGVKIGKREPLLSGIAQSGSSVLSPTFKAGQPWDTFESLAEEITHLADTFTKVTFDDINMHERRVLVSLHGPFGVERASVYIKCRIEIPLGYPNKEPAWATIESTAGLSDEAALQATSDLQLVTYAYQERQRHSLEAILRYLLGEQSRDEILDLLKARPDPSNFEMDHVVDFTSSDEDDSDDQYANEQVPGMESSDGMLAVSNAQYNVPLPKACGALWADDGRLVCFFPPKDERQPSFLEPFSLKAGRWTSKDRRNMFEGFGRLRAPPSDSEWTSSNLETIESGDSDFEESSQSSSSSAFSSGFGTAPLKLMPSIAWREGPQDAHRALSIDESQKSSGANAQTVSAVRSSMNFVSIHQCSELLPAKRHLAKEYSLESRTKSCKHNAAVARKEGALDLADVWEFLSLILDSEVPLQHTSISHPDEPILVIARRTLSPLRQSDSAVDLSYDFQDEAFRATTTGPVYWGSHPFGRRWLVNALFEHFESLADTQMLAMLSCVLQQSPDSMTTLPCHTSTHADSHQSLELHDSHPLAVAGRYFPTADVASSMLQPSAIKPAFSLDMQRPSSDPHSAASSVGASTGDSLTPFSSSLTPPMSFKPSQTKHLRSISQIPMSTSPEQLKHIHRSGSNLASAFAASIARPFSFSTPESSSPPTTQPKRVFSPGSSHTGAGNSNVAWGSLAISGQADTTSRTPRSRMTPPILDVQAAITDEGQSFSTKLKNQDQFANDAYAAESLLDPSKEERYASYRASYASMLLTWELPAASCAVLQYNKRPAVQPAPQVNQDQLGAKSQLVIGRNSHKTAAVDSEDLRLDVRRLCENCAVTLPAGPVGERCSACMTKQAPVICQLCHSIILGLSSPCLNCGHVLHLSCRSSLQHTEDSDLDTACVTGCGCFCANHLVVDVQFPLPTDERKPSISTTATLFPSEQEEDLPWRDGGDDSEATEGDAWEDVAYESLAKNLGGRFLTPKPSQIWRGGESRKGSFTGFPRLRRSESG